MREEDIFLTYHVIKQIKLRNKYNILVDYVHYKIYLTFFLDALKISFAHIDHIFHFFSINNKNEQVLLLI